MTTYEDFAVSIATLTLTHQHPDPFISLTVQRAPTAYSQQYYSNI